PCVFTLLILFSPIPSNKRSTFSALLVKVLISASPIFLSSCSSISLYNSVLYFVSLLSFPLLLLSSCLKSFSYIYQFLKTLLLSSEALYNCTISHSPIFVPPSTISLLSTISLTGSDNSSSNLSYVFFCI